ncbi:MAG TPA: ferredoxin-thioredoxin reductase catalytic domain-containing protein [Mariprofundaceae bacterium]|nr:ferredoxin-thioredoxin reductase catalytic domain-containing protein [Mariprofundaceae bacterium]
MKKTPCAKSLAIVDRLIAAYTKKSGTFTHPDAEVTESVRLGLARHMDEVNKLLCPCRFYPDKAEEVKHRTWICPCDDMQVYKFCHCLLFVTEQGMPITEYLPEGHEGRDAYGEVEDPTPDKGRLLRHRAQEREDERHCRPS